MDHRTSQTAETVIGHQKSECSCGAEDNAPPDIHDISCPAAVPTEHQCRNCGDPHAEIKETFCGTCREMGLNETSHGTFCAGQRFTHLSADDFGTINRAANQQNLMAFITEMSGAEDDRLISFELIARPQPH